MRHDLNVEAVFIDLEVKVIHYFLRIVFWGDALLSISGAKTDMT